MTKILTAKQMAQMDQFEVQITIYNSSIKGDNNQILLMEDNIIKSN